MSFIKDTDDDSAARDREQPEPSREANREGSAAAVEGSVQGLQNAAGRNSTEPGNPTSGSVLEELRAGPGFSHTVFT